MKITFPHMGHCYLAVEALLNEMGHEVIVPPRISKKTLSLGTKYSPETVCMPLKLNVGSFIEAIEMGADTILMIGGAGPCRLGYYAAVEQEILEDLGKEVEFIILEHPRENFSKLKTQVQHLVAKKGLKGLLRGLQLGWEKLVTSEKLIKLSLYVRPRELIQGRTTQLLNAALEQLRSLNSIYAIRRFYRHCCESMLDNTDTTLKLLKVGLVGEIYTILEPFANMQIEERLGYLNVEVDRTVSLQQWFKDHVVRASLHLYSDRPLRKLAKDYLQGPVGGHGLETIARTVALAQKDYAGIVHILPLTCMPEIIAQCILPRVSADLHIPIISLVVDEHTTDAGFQTRLEAFVDLLTQQSGRGCGYGL